MDRKEVLQAIEYCMAPAAGDPSPCDSCPMMEAGCDEGFTEFIEVPKCLMDEIVTKLKEGSEWSHVAYVRTRPRGPIQ